MAIYISKAIKTFIPFNTIMHSKICPRDIISQKKSTIISTIMYIKVLTENEPAT